MSLVPGAVPPNQSFKRTAQTPAFCRGRFSLHGAGPPLNSVRRQMRTTITAILLAFACTLAWPAESSEAVQASSFVVVSEARLPDAERFRSALEGRLKGRLKVDHFESDGKEVILLRIKGGTVMIGLIGTPLPKGTVDDLCPSAWYWKAACEATSRHKGHIYVNVLQTSLTKLDAALLQTDVVASLMDENAIASYWGASLQSREAFLKQSATASPDNPPVWLWINFRVTNEPNGISISTDGMKEFGLREIETKEVNRNARDVFLLFLGTAQYLIQKGPVIKDGETIGESPALNIRVRLGPSYWREGLNVYRIVFPKGE